MYWKIYRSIPFGYPYIVHKELKECKSILDLGCGSLPLVGKIGLDTIYSVGVEVLPKGAKKSKNYLNDVIIGDISDMDFPEGSFDCVVSIDVIEHFLKKEALSLILHMKKWARKKVIISTPHNKQPGIVDPDLDANFIKYQKHKCVFLAEELRGLGFRLYGIRGIKHLKPNWRRKIPTLKIISLLTLPVVKNRPELASGLLGILEV